MDRRIVPILAAAACLNFGRAAAQDVSVGDPVWDLPDPAPEQLQRARNGLRPDYPDEMRDVPKIGYVLVTRFVDSAGRSRTLQAVGTDRPFQRAVEKEFQYWNVAPAKRDGRPVDTSFWLPVIFNPGSHATKAYDRIPHLLAVTRVRVKRSAFGDLPNPIVVRLHVGLDAAGALSRVESEPDLPLPEKLMAAVETALREWRFSPALLGGRPVAAEVALSVIVEATAPAKAAAKKLALPTVVKQVRPEYPFVMRKMGIRGEVLVDFVVDKNGHVANPFVVRSNGPAFDWPAIEAVRQWVFEPGRVDGRAVNAHMQVPIVFELRGLPSNGRDSYVMAREKSGGTFLPKIRSVMKPVYPHDLEVRGVTGAAKMTIVVGSDGRIAGLKIDSASQPEFGLALAAAANGFFFDPGFKDGNPVASAVAYEQEFNSRDLEEVDSDGELMALEKRHPEKIVSAGSLDHPVSPVSRRPPIFPAELSGRDIGGEATIEFLIDSDGRARLPRIVSASEDAFGYAAVQAVASWLFEPPTVAGRPVTVRVRVPFRFGREGDGGRGG